MNKWLDGKKTKLAGIAATLTALGTIVGTLQDGFQVADLQVWGISITGVMVIIGFGGKFQKIIEALNEKK